MGRNGESRLNGTAKTLVEAVAALGTLSCLGFYALCGCGIGSFLKRRRKVLKSPLPENQPPPVSVLKPLKGIDPEIWESFCSHCEQDYPDYQLIFGVSDAQDPAAGEVRRLQEKYPQRQIELVVCDRDLGTNPKVSNLAQMLPSARHEVLLVNDSDIRVPPDYVWRVIAPLADDSVGLVTCLYRAVAGRTLGSRLEALSVSTDFVPAVLSARFLEKGLRFGLGSTLAFRRHDLEKIGGFEGLTDYLADDYELGRRMAGLGKRVELSEVVVDTFLPAYSLRQFFAHQMRWARTIRDARRWGYVGVLLTFGLPWALALVLAAQGAAWAWLLFAVTVTARVLVAWFSARVVLGGGGGMRDFLLLPVRDLMAPLVWAMSFFGDRISWRGDRLYLKDGKLVGRSREAAGR
ncbi:MAG: bacteriohopanetetrol glucosamine biosynthesis glycosyltransferase HpnI [Terriglobales bacterium]